MPRSTIGRVPISEPGPLISPYKKDEGALIRTAEDFTVSINTIPLQLYTKYKDHYKAGQFDNDYFAVMSQTGLGDREKPIVKAHYLEHIDNMTEDKTAIWAENVAVVEDYCKDSRSERLYLSFSSFCQGLGGSPLDRVTDSLTRVANDVGAAFPMLVPYTSIGKVAVAGINNLLKTILMADFKPQVKTSTFALYPYREGQPVVIGEAPLQEGAYAFFFEPVELDNLRMEEDGIVTSIAGEAVAPYLAINIKKGITLAPGQIEKSLAAEVLESYNRNVGVSLQPSETGVPYFQALEELGKSLRLANSTKRFFELKKRSDTLSDVEAERLKSLVSYLKENLEDSDSIFTL
jgi:hypothetical protein